MDELIFRWRILRASTHSRYAIYIILTAHSISKHLRSNNSIMLLTF